MEFIDYVVYRKGRLIKDPRRGLPNRMRVAAKRGFAQTWSDPKPKPRYFYSQRVHHTAFVVASASDLRTYMNAANARMREIMKSRGDKEGERLFRREDHFEVETFLFPCDKYGNWKDSGELPGSQKGTLDHRVPFRDVGYLVVGMPRGLVLLGDSIDKIEVDTGSGFTAVEEAK